MQNLAMRSDRVAAERSGGVAETAETAEVTEATEAEAETTEAEARCVDIRWLVDNSSSMHYLYKTPTSGLGKGW